jgi:hypothetical protein
MERQATGEQQLTASTANNTACSSALAGMAVHHSHPVHRYSSAAIIWYGQLVGSALVVVAVAAC